jgi:hypothetical protein
MSFLRSFDFGYAAGIGSTVKSALSPVPKFVILNRNSLGPEKCVVMKSDQHILFILAL